MFLVADGAIELGRLLGYLSVLWGMVGSMDTIAPLESSRDRLVFLRHKNKDIFTTRKKQKCANNATENRVKKIVNVKKGQ